MKLRNVLALAAILAAGSAWAAELKIGFSGVSPAGWKTATTPEANGRGAHVELLMDEIAGVQCGKMIYGYTGKHSDAQAILYRNFKPVDQFKSIRIQLYTTNQKRIFLRYRSPEGRTFAYQYAVKPEARWQTIECNFKTAIPGAPYFNWGGKVDNKKDRVWHDKLAAIEICLTQAHAIKKGEAGQFFAVGDVTIVTDDAPAAKAPAAKNAIAKAAPTVQLPIGITTGNSLCSWWSGKGAEVKGATVDHSFKPGTLAGKKCAILNFKLLGKNGNANATIGKTLPQPVSDFRAVKMELYNPDFKEIFIRFMDQNGRVFAYKYAVRPATRWQTVEFSFANAIPGEKVFSWGGKKEVKEWGGALKRIEICFPKMGAVGAPDKMRTAAIGAVTVLAR